MHGSIKILPTHMNRPAIVYLRQSDPKQVRDHRESAINQRALRESDCLSLGGDASRKIDDERSLNRRFFKRWRESFRLRGPSLQTLGQ